jgi:hypothetical protein
MNKNMVIGAVLVVLLGAGAYIGLRGWTLDDDGVAPVDPFGSAPDSSPFLSDVGAQRLAQGYLALVLDGPDSWQPVPEEGLKKNHGISHPQSTCPDIFPPTVLVFPDTIADLGPPPFNLAINDNQTPWLDHPLQVPVTQGPGTFFETRGYEIVQAPDNFFYSHAFTTTFNCNIPSLETQNLSSGLNVSLYASDNTLIQTFTVPIGVDVFAQADFPSDDGFFVDGFEGWGNCPPVAPSAVQPGTPEEDCWNLIVFP